MTTFHPLSETTSKAPAELSVCIVFLVLTYISVGARCWVRLFMIRSFGWDDALMCISLVRFYFCYSSQVTDFSNRSSLLYIVRASLSLRTTTEVGRILQSSARLCMYVLLNILQGHERVGTVTDDCINSGFS